MGRVKLEIKKLESKTSRLTTYSKRKIGLIKKTSELAVLCDTDVVLLMFSPTGKPVLWKTKNSSFEGILERYAALTPHERARRKLESFDALKKSFKKSDHMIHAGDFFGSSYQTIGDLTTRANLLRHRLSEVQNRLSDWENPDKINDIQRLDHMEDYIRELLDQIHAQKEKTRKQQFSALGCNNLSEMGMHLPSSLRPLDLEQQVRQCSWIQNDDSQRTFSPKDPHLLSGKETELSGGSSLGNCCSDFIGAVENSEFASIRKEVGLLRELMKTESLRNELIGLRAEAMANNEILKNEMMTSEYLRNELMKAELLTNQLIENENKRNELMQAEDSFLRNDLMKVTEEAENSRLQQLLYQQQQQYSCYDPHHDLGGISYNKILHSASSQVDLQFCIDDLCVDGNTGPSQSDCGFDYSNWPSTSGTTNVIR